jgi:hypothetical protein
MPMPRRRLFDVVISLEGLELKLSPTPLSVAGLPTAPAMLMVYHPPGHDHTLPHDATAQALNSGMHTAIEYPILPASGPGGPGS